MSKKSQKYYILRRWGRRIGWVFLGVFLLLILFRFSLKTAFIQDWVRSSVVTMANQQLNATLSIGRLTGDLWKELTLSNIRLSKEDDTIVQVDSLYARYNVWGFLQGDIDINELRIYRPQANLKQQAGQWNVQNIVPVSEDTTDTSTSASSWHFYIEELQLASGDFAISSDSLPLEPGFAIQNLDLSSSIAYGADFFNVNLGDLSFVIANSRLDQPVRVQTAASAQADNITLEKLLVATGNSMIQSSGFVSALDSSVQFNFLADPVAWNDFASYIRDFPLRQDVGIDLSLKGKPEQFELSIAADAPSLKSFVISSQFQWRSALVLQQLQVKSAEINAAELLVDSTLPSLKELDAEFSGSINIAEYQQARGELRFAAREVESSPYHLDLLSGEGKLDGQTATVKLQANEGQQQLKSHLQVDQLWTEEPIVAAKIEGKDLNPGYWIQDSTYAGNISFQSEIAGRGWYPEEQPWKYSVSMRDAHFMGQPVKLFSAKGDVSGTSASLGAQLEVRNGVVQARADLQNIREIPAYNYQLKTENFDFGSLLGREDFKTALNSTIRGQGHGFDPGSMKLNSSVAIDSSVVNGELLQNLSAHLSVDDSIAVVNSANISSTIADGDFNLRLNMLRRKDPQNELSFNLLLKDLEALAPLANVEKLQAEGEINGKLLPAENGNLRFLSTLNLSHIAYNTLFAAKRAKGSMDIHLLRDIEYLVDIDLQNPAFSGVKLQNMKLLTQGSYADSAAVGKFNFSFSSPTEGRIEQGGNYSLAPDNFQVNTDELNVISDYRTLTLEKPFDLLIQDETIQLDTMRVSSGDGAYFEMGIPVISEKEQRGFIRGKELNTAVLQSCFMGETLFEGMLSGKFDISRRDTSLAVTGAMALTEISYKDTSFDSLRISGDIVKERLNGTLSVYHEKRELVNGHANLPFKLGDPEKLPPSFFKEPVEGSIQVRDIAIDRFQSLFAEAGLMQTSGILSMRGRLEGMAGVPVFSADAALKEAKLSGVAVDSVTAGVNYRHEDEELQLSASVVSMRQKAADIHARFPFFINMRTFQLNLPQAKDSINVDIATNEFNLKAVNDFINQQTLRDVTGQLDGMVHVMGAMGDLKTDGQLQLNDAAFRLPQAGIRIDNIQTELQFDPNQLRLTNFSAQSGKGNLSASGALELEKLMPGEIDFNIKAQNFRAANTSQYNAVVDLDMRAQGNINRPEIAGDLRFISGFLKLQNFGEKSVESIELDTTAEQEQPVSLYDSLALDMDINFDRRFYIQNERYLDMEIELAGQLDLLKELGEELELFGTISAPSGYARPLGKQFDLEEGTVSFSGPPGNPQLAIRTRYEPPQTQEDITIWYVIEGTVEKPKFKYESEPPMELENIISYTLFGQPFYALDSWKQVVASSGSNTTAADVALDVLLDRVEALATQKLGIDVVKIDNTTAGGETGTSITTGWYLNPKVFFAIQNVITGSTPDTGFLLEYMLRKDLKLIIRQGNGIQQGVDVRWNYDY
jgi:autotransporter translocation and assembly factor TamB